MSLFGKIKSAVMGNPITRDYEVGKHFASAGPGLLWKIHNGVKKTTKQEVSVFVFDKKSQEFEKLPKKHREPVLTMLKKGPTFLIRLKHPCLLTIERQLEESNDSLMFVTEPVTASLANIVGHYENLPNPLPLSIKEHQLHPIEVQYGLLQIAESLDFLHSDAKMLHGNITPESIVINSKGAWKLMGFNFASFSQSQSEISFAFREWDTKGSIYSNPSLDYLAPDYVLKKSCNQASDMFSYGMLCYAVYNEGKPLFSNHNNIPSFKNNAEQISRISESRLGQVPDEFKHIVKSMLVIEPNVRPDALQLTKHAFFEEVGVSTLKYLDMLFQRSDIEKSQFFKKNLARVIGKLPKRVVHQHVLPALSEEFRNNKMIPFVLPLVLLIAEDCSLQEYGSLVMPVLIPALSIQDPVQVPLIFFQKMDLLLKKTSQENIKRYILPLITTSLESEHRQLQELCITVLPTFANMVDYSSMKHSLVPRITALCLMAGESPLVVKCLVCLGQLMDILDKHIVLDSILPILEQISSKEPGILMAILGIYHQTLNNKKLGIDKAMLANRVLTFLIPLSIEPCLNLKQFNQFMLVIREMLAKVESEQQAYLEQLSKMEEQTQSTVSFALEVSENKAMDDAISNLEGMFSDSPPGKSRGETVGARRGLSPPTTSAGTTNIAATTDLFGDLTGNGITASTTSKKPPISSSTAAKSSPPSVGKVINFSDQSQLSFLQPTQVLQPTTQHVPSQPKTFGGTNSTHPLGQRGASKGQTGSTGSTSYMASGSTGSTGYMAPPLQQQAPASSNGMFSGMNVNSNSFSSPSQQHVGGILQPARSNVMFESPHSSQFGGPTVSPSLTRMSTEGMIQQQQPLMPSPAPPGNSSLGGWSSSIAPQSTSAVGSGPSGVNTLASGRGWSSNIAPTGSTGWSQNSNIGMEQPLGTWSGMEPGHQQYSGMGSGHQQYSGMEPGHQQYSGMNWSSNVQPVGQSVSTMQPLQPQAVTTATKPAPSANPFADLSFLG